VPLDTTLYRAAAGVLATTTALITGEGTSKRIEFSVDRLGGGQAQISFGSAADVNLYRVGVGNLKTDGTLLVGGHLGVDNANGGYKLFFGGSADTNLYRLQANWLKTDGALWVSGELLGAGVVSLVSDAASIRFGGAADTNLYRAAASQLKTDGQFFASGGLYGGWTGSTWALAAVNNGDVSVARNLTVVGNIAAANFPGAGGALTSSSVFLTGDVGFAANNTLYDGPSLTLAAGTYVLVASANILSSAAGTVYARLTDGTTTLVDGNGAIGTSTAAVSIPLMTVVSPTGSTTYKIQGSAGNSGVATMKATASVNGVANKATYIYAIKIA
jgi:hypothetical protein